MGGSRPIPSAIPFVVPSSSPVLGVYGSQFSGYVEIRCNADIDLTEYEEIPGGMELMIDGEWVLADYTMYDPETSTSSVFCIFDGTVNTQGLPFRVVSPISSLTAGGVPIGAEAGTTLPEDLIMAAKIAGGKVLTKPVDRR